MKHTDHEILEAFKSDKPKKTAFGNYRISGDQLVYRAQTSDDVPGWHDDTEFTEVRKKIGALIRETDGKLTQDGKPVLLEALTKNSPSRGLRIQFHKTDLIAQKVKTPNGYVYLGNASILPLVGRTVAYGNVSPNRHETSIQREMQMQGFMLMPLTAFAASDFSTFQAIEMGPETCLQAECMVATNRWNKIKKTFYLKASAMLFKLEETHYLFDIDRREVKYDKYMPFVVELTSPAKTIAEAYESLKPDEVIKAEASGLAVKRQGSHFFIPVPPPTLPVLSIDEKLHLLGTHARYGIDAQVLKYLTGKDCQNEKAAQAILEKVPRSVSLIEGAGCVVQTGILIEKTTYCKGVIESPKRASLTLAQWHIAVLTKQKRKVKK